MTGAVILIDRCVRCPFGYDYEEILCFAHSYIYIEDGWGPIEFTEDEVWHGEGMFDDGIARLPMERPEWCPLNESSYLLKAK